MKSNVYRLKDGIAAASPVCRRYSLRPFALLLLPVLLSVTGCFSVPENARLTLPEGARPLTEPFEAATTYPCQKTDFLTYTELESLATNPCPSGTLRDKLVRFWETPIISNAAWGRGVRPRRPTNRHLGDYLRVASWNIEHSLHVKRAGQLLASQAAYLQHMDPSVSEKQKKEYLRQRDRLACADVLILQEIDIGTTRSDYIHGPEVLAQALGMNYAYAPQQLEVGPILQELEPEELDGLALPEQPPPDPARYRGVMGLLVLSKYPVKSAECFQLQTRAYDWYDNELERYDIIEEFRRFGTKQLFQNEIVREAKVGGRIFFRVDLEVPGLPGDTLSIINVHLEIKTRPGERTRQIREILDQIGDIENPVVLAGDFNSSRYDMSPTSLPRFTTRLLQNPNVWISSAVNLLAPAYTLFNTGRSVLNELKNLHNPVASHIPVALPNKARGLFREIQAYRFADGGRFDFRGDDERSINSRAAMLSNSNEKGVKGYRTTFAVDRPIGPFGLERLDWMFVKSGFYTDEDDSYRLAPHFGETLNAFHGPMPDALSDHRPIVVDLPLHCPETEVASRFSVEDDEAAALRERGVQEGRPPPPAACVRGGDASGS